MVAVPAHDDLRRVLDDDGKPLPGAKLPAIPDATLQQIFDKLLLVRTIDARMMQLHAEGKLGFYLQASGEEATHFAVAALRDTDWVFPSHRDHGAWFWRGYSIEQYVDQLFGNAGDPAKGRQLSGHHSAGWLRLVSVSPSGTHIPQAVGAAYGARVTGKDELALAMFGERAAAGGDFHVGLNFAGVWKAACIFLCRSKGTSRTLSARAVGYGFPALRVDGNDVLAVWQATTDAAARARAGAGATLIEAVTSEQKDAARRLRGYLKARGLWSEAWEHELVQRHEQQLADALAAAARKPAPPRETLFDDVFEQLPWHLREQLQD